MKKILIGIAIAAFILIIGAVIYFAATPGGRKAWNEYWHDVSMSDEVTYETKKQVEDTCRSMIAQYNADKLIYEQYKESDSAEERSWASQARIRANQTASVYNNYILKNSYVWKDNVPQDIFLNLAPIVD